MSGASFSLLQLRRPLTLLKPFSDLLFIIIIQPYHILLYISFKFKFFTYVLRKTQCGRNVYHMCF